MSSFSRMTIVRRRYPLVDDMGTSVADFAATPDTSSIEGCWLEPIESQVNEDGRLAVLTGWTGTAPAGTVLNALTDQILFKGVAYELAGDAMDIESPTGALNEVKFSLRRWRHAV